MSYNEKLKTPTISEHFQNQNVKFVERGNIDSPNIQIHDRYFSWLIKDISVKRGGFKLVVHNTALF